MDFDSTDAVILFLIAAPAAVISSFSRSYIKELAEIKNFTEHVAKTLGVDTKFVHENSTDAKLILKLIGSLVVLVLFSVQVYEIGEMYTYVIAGVFFIVSFAFSNKDGIDVNQASIIALNLLDKISESNRLNNTKKSKELARVIDFVINKFGLDRATGKFESGTYISYVDTLYGNERVAYQAKSFFNKIITTVKVVIPLIGIILLIKFFKISFS